MKNISFPLFSTKVSGVTKRFNLEDPVSRREYFDLKARADIEKIKEYLEAGNTFVAFLLGKKNSGKGTYAKLFMEAVGREHVAHLSVGDVVRNTHKELSDEAKRAELLEFLQKRYRGFISVEKIFDVIEGRDTKTLLPTEVILALVEREIDRLDRKAIFVDGFPRNLDQISYSLFFRSLIGYREDPDFFVFIDVPEAVIDERMKHRVVCPVCQTPRNTRVLCTKEVGYDATKQEFYLICDDPKCGGARMVAKEGDSLGIEAIRDRVQLDEQIMETLSTLQGVSKIYLRNSIPVAGAATTIDEYEITPGYRFELEGSSPAHGVKIIQEPWVVNDDSGTPSNSLLPAPVVLSLLKQMVEVLGL